MSSDQPSVVVDVRDSGLDGYPPDRGLICIAIGYQLLQLQPTSSYETESWAHGAWAIHMTFPQRSQRVGVVESDATLLEVKAHTEPGRQRVGEAWGGGRAVADGVSDAVALVMVVVVVVAVLGQVDLSHPHREEAEGWSRVQAIFCTAVVTTVWVVAGQVDKWGWKQPL